MKPSRLCIHFCLVCALLLTALLVAPAKLSSPVRGAFNDEIQFRGRAITALPACPGCPAGWVVNVLVVISGPDITGTVVVVTGQAVQPPCDRGYVDPAIQPLDLVEVYGSYEETGSGVRVCVCCDDEYYITRLGRTPTATEMHTPTLTRTPAATTSPTRTGTAAPTATPTRTRTPGGSYVVYLPVMLRDARPQEVTPTPTLTLTPTRAGTRTITVTPTHRPTATASRTPAPTETTVPAALTVIRSFPAPPGTQPNGLAWDGQYLWMSSYSQNGGIYRLDPLDGSVLNRYTPPAASYFGYGGLAFDGAYLWEADGYGSGIYKLSTSDASVVSTIPSPDNHLYGDLAWDGSHLWTAGYPSGKFYRIQPSDGAVVAALEPPGAASLQVGMAYFQESLWLSDEGQLLQVHPTEWRVMATFTHSISKPKGLAWDGQYLWIASFTEAMIYVCSMDQ